MRVSGWLHTSALPTPPATRLETGGLGPPGLVPALALALLLGACGDASDSGASGASAPAEPTGPATWTLSEEPLLEIGVVEGDDPYQFHDVRDVAGLPDGGLVVANQGSKELRFFDADGDFLFASGEAGDGPGEWRLLEELRVLHPDTLLVLDPRLGRTGLVSSADGAYLGVLDGARADSLVWPRHFHAGFVLEAPLDSAELGVLGPVVEGLDVMGPERPAFVTADREGRVWVRSAPSAERSTLRLYDLEGRLWARLELPDGFQLLELDGDRAMGVYRDDFDVEFVRVHEVAGRGEWTGAPLASVVEETAPAPLPDLWVLDAAPEEVVGALKSMAVTQEVHYAERMRYTSDLDALGSERFPLAIPEGVQVDILAGGASGWMARMMDTVEGGGCVISYGAFRAAGNLTPGRVTCWEAGPGG